MHQYSYVLKKDYLNFKKDIIRLLNLVQDEVRNNFTLQFEFIGVEPRNLVTRDLVNNLGYDLQIAITVNDDDQRFTAREIIEILKKGFNTAAEALRMISIEENENIINIKYREKGLTHNISVTVISEYYDEELDRDSLEYIASNLEWTEAPNEYYQFKEMCDYIKEYELGKVVRFTYFRLINSNKEYKSTLEILFDAVNRVYNNYNK